MSTLHIYQSNVGSKLILRSPLVQLAEQWRDRSGSTEPIILMTHSRVEELDYTSRNYLLYPLDSKSADELTSFVVQRGGELKQNAKLKGMTLTGIHFTLPWLPVENPETVGEPTDRAGVLEIVEFPAEEVKYIHVDSQIVQALAKWKQDSSFTAPIVIWSVVDTDDDPAHRSTRLLWPTDERHVAALLAKLESEKKLKVYLSPVPNPGSYADPWGKVSDLSCILPADEEPEVSIQRQTAYAYVVRRRTSTESSRPLETSQKLSADSDTRDRLSPPPKRISDDSSQELNHEKRKFSIFHRKKHNK